MPDGSNDLSLPHPGLHVGRLSRFRGRGAIPWQVIRTDDAATHGLRAAASEVPYAVGDSITGRYPAHVEPGLPSL